MLWILISLGLFTRTAARPVQLAKPAADAAVRQIEKDREESQRWLQSDPTSYLATIDRRDFGEKKTLTVGSATDNDIRLDAPGIAEHHVRVTIDGDRFRIESIDRQARFRVDREERREVTVDPSNIQVGRFVLRLSHQRFPAIIVFDPESPRFKEYKGLKYFAVDLGYRYELPLTPNPKPETVVIMSTRGNQRRAIRVGWFDFMVGGKPCRLEAMRLLEPGVAENDVQILFRDMTSGSKTYALGRYLDVRRLRDGNYVLDFNSAYNPACAFSDHYNCPIPPKANSLKVGIRAGEMDSHYH